MLLIGENLNVVSKMYGPALKERNAQQVSELAVAQKKQGMDLIDLNIGPARKDGEELMGWLVKTVQEATGLPLSLDTTNAAAIKAGLEVHKGKALINSISVERMVEELPMAVKYDADFIGLLWGREGLPRDANERGAIAAELLYNANALGITNERIWFDPIVTPAVNIESNHVKPGLEFLGMLPDLAPGARSVVGLSNVSNGAPNHLRPILNRTYLMMLMKYNIYAAIVDAFDDELIAIARGKRPELVNFVHHVMDGEPVDITKLEPEFVRYAKTVKVLLGINLYSHSWLDT